MTESLKDKAEKKKAQKKDRGTQDDLEILRLIVSENKILFMKVMDKIKLIQKTGVETKASEAIGGLRATPKKVPKMNTPKAP